jgi:hypothetical protein
MALFDPKSRYVRFARIIQVVDRRGRIVQALSAADKSVQTKLGSHRHKDGQRLDHLASHYLQDPNAFWRIAELNEVALPDAIADADLIDIPVAGG